MIPMDAIPNPAPGGPGDRLLSWRKVKDITGLSRTTTWRRQKAGDFPLAVQISPGRVGWWESELRAWTTSRAPRSSSSLPALPTPAVVRKPAPRCEGPTAPPPPACARPPESAAKATPSSRRGGGRVCEGQIAFLF